MVDTSDQFRQAIRRRLGVDPGSIVLDGKVRRFPTKPNGRDEAGWYIGFDDNIPAGSFGDWRSGITDNWCNRDVLTLTPAERAEHRRQMGDAARIRENERRLVQAAAAVKAENIWRESHGTAEHPYLKSKCVGSYGLRISRGSLVVPVRIGSILVGLQFIAADGAKKFLTGGAVASGYHAIGKPDELVVICEGYATGATIHAVTGHAVAIAFSAGNLEAVAHAIQTKLPKARLIIAADDDYETDGNPGMKMAHAAAVAVRGVVAIPPFNRADGEVGTDWNDFHQLHGEDQTRQAFAVAINSSSADTIESPNGPMPSQTVADVDAADFVRLAKLDAIGYDRERKPIAKRLGVREATLDAEVKKIRERLAVASMAGLFPLIEPWPDQVGGANLLDDIHKTISRFIICEQEAKVACTLWIAFTWLIDAFQVAPLAVITAPEKRCGKTQLLDLIGRLSKRSLVASNISSAAVFRVIEAHKPTLLIDEADAFMRDNEELRGIINSGHTRTSAYVIRTVGDDHEPRQFPTFGAKAISGIGSLPETIMDRAIILELRRKLPSETVGRLRHAPPNLFPTLARKLARFALDNEHRMLAARPSLPDALNDRAQDNWEPLLAIADLAGGHWPDTARKTAIKISGGENEAVSTGTELLADIKAAFEIDNCNRIAITTLIERLIADDMGPWATWNRGKPISPRQLGKRLQEYAVAARTFRFGAGTSKGFERWQFEDAWARYLAAPEAALPKGN